MCEIAQIPYKTTMPNDRLRRENADSARRGDGKTNGIAHTEDNNLFCTYC